MDTSANANPTLSKSLSPLWMGQTPTEIAAVIVKREREGDMKPKKGNVFTSPPISQSKKKTKD